MPPARLIAARPIAARALADEPIAARRRARVRGAALVMCCAGPAWLGCAGCMGDAPVREYQQLRGLVIPRGPHVADAATPRQAVMADALTRPQE